MTSESILQFVFVGAVAYQFIIVSALGVWLWRNGISVPSATEISSETTTERRRMGGVVVLFWIAISTIIIAI